jgi:hypothetical protein
LPSETVAPFQLQINRSPKSLPTAGNRIMEPSGACARGTWRNYDAFFVFTTSQDGRTCAFNMFTAVANGSMESSEFSVFTACLFDSLNQVKGSGDTADWLGGYRG